MLTVVTPYGVTGASARVRTYEWLDRLPGDKRVENYLGTRSAGARVLVGRLPDVLRAEGRLRRLDVSRDILLLHREASPLSDGSLELRLLRAAARAVYDFDDALQWDLARGGLRGLRPKAPKAEACARAADTVVAGSDTLADWASRFARQVVMVPSCVDTALYRPKDDYALGDPPRLGWVGSPSAERYLRPLEQPLLEVHRRTGARLVVVSAGAAPLGPLDAMTDRVDWSAATVAEVTAGLDVGLAPLPDDLSARGKCAYKILQYGAAGLPVVGSPVGANRLVLERLGAEAALSPADWADAVLGLLELSSAERARRGAAARAAVVSDYSYDAWQPVVQRVLGLAE